MCGHENGVLVAYGVDELGEWESVECETCGRTWMLRGKEQKMQVNGYEIGTEPTSEEWRIYRRVKSYLQREVAAQYLGTRHGRPIKQERFEEFCTIFAGLEMEQGEDEYDNLCDAWDELFGIIPVHDPWDE